MTTADTQTHAKTPKAAGRFRLPDPPRREPDEMTQYDKLFKTGRSRDLAIHLGNPETTLVEADRWIVADTSFNKARARRPDLLVAFDVDPEIYRANNGYIVSEQGKPPDFVLEVASESTGDADVGVKRDYYQSLRIREYWRFDETGRYHGTRLAGDRLVGDHYEPIDIDELVSDVLQGYSMALSLHLRWERGELGLYVPDTGRHIVTLEDERARADRERAMRMQAEAERNAATARVRELEEQLRRHRNQN